MKKTIMVLAAILLASSYTTAQVVQENEATIVYYMPKTELLITLEYDVITQTPGVFYQYAAYYLGTCNVITEYKTQYSLTHITTRTHVSSDRERAFQVVGQKGIDMQLLALSEDGRLLGYNIEYPTSISPVIPITPAKTALPTAQPMPLLEEQLIAGSTAKMAEGAAKQIYRIRETRLNLLAGEVEHVPADGAAMKLVLEELDKREQELVDLFVGTTTIQHHTSCISYCPEADVDKEVICRFSQHSGVVSNKDLSGSPITLTSQSSKPSIYKTEINPKAPLLSQIYYNLPGEATISIAYNGKQMSTGTYTIAQYGIAVPLALDLFTGKQMPIIHIHPNTGNIQSIQR